MAAVCYVTAADYARYFAGTALDTPAAPVFGPERRTALDRRRPGHERRWEASRGRRFHDRRRRRRCTIPT